MRHNTQQIDYETKGPQAIDLAKKMTEESQSKETSVDELDLILAELMKLQNRLN